MRTEALGRPGGYEAPGRAHRTSALTDGRVLGPIAKAKSRDGEKRRKKKGGRVQTKGGPGPRPVRRELVPEGRLAPG